METRSLPVPEGLAGERVDAAIAKLLGFSRTFAAEVAESGGVRLDGRTLGKSDRLTADAWLEVEWQAKSEVAIVPVVVVDLAVVYDDDDIIVVDKPPGVAAHPSIGWEGPTVLGALAAAGYRVSTSGAAERAGIVHRLDVGTSGLMVVAKSERAYTELKRQFHDREVGKIYHAVVQGHPDPSAGTIDAPIGRHPGASWRFAITADGKHSVTHYETLEAFPRRVVARDRAGDGTHAPDPGAHGGAAASLCRRRDVRRRPDDLGAPRPHPAVAARQAALVRPPRDGRASDVRIGLSGRPSTRA